MLQDCGGLKQWDSREECTPAPIKHFLMTSLPFEKRGNVHACSVMSDSLLPPWLVGLHTPPFMKFSPQKYSGREQENSLMCFLIGQEACDSEITLLYWSCLESGKELFKSERQLFKSERQFFERLWLPWKETKIKKDLQSEADLIIHNEL